jgi:hypothetical protein
VIRLFAMPTVASSQLPPPRSWDEFEDICADLFMLEWNDRNTIRYGRRGQRQYGVDILGEIEEGYHVGVQCKGRRRWPPATLTKADVDRDVAEALKLRPKLSELIFATTAPEDSALADHARLITEHHRKDGLFSVAVFGWDELVRRLTRHASLVEKHYGYVELKSIPEKTVALIAEHLLKKDDDARPRNPQGERSLSPTRHERISETENFVGREEAIRILERAYFEKANDRPAPIVITGLSGVGKTTLAREFAWLYQERYAVIWWLNADSAEDIIWGLFDLAVRVPEVSVRLDDSTPKSRESAAKRILMALSESKPGKPHLLIYDDAKSPTLVRNWLPRRNVHVLCTSLWSSDWHGVATPLPLDVLAADDGTKFIEARAGWRDPDNATRLATDLGCLPLALDHAGAYCKETLMSFAEYRAKVSELIRRAPAVTTYPRSVFATFDLCIAKALEITSGAEALMGILAVIGSERIPGDLVPEDAMAAIELGDAIGALRRVSLISAERTEHGVWYIGTHRLVQEVMKARLADRGAANEAFATALLFVARVWPIDPKDDNWNECVALLPHAVVLLDEAPVRLEGLDDRGWLAYRKTKLTERVNRFRQRAAEDEIAKAFLNVEEDRRSPEKQFARLRPEQQQELVQITLEDPSNERFAPVLKMLKSQPASVQRELQASAELAQHMTGLLRKLFSCGDENKIRELVRNHMRDFPAHLQNDLRLAFGETSGRAAEYIGEIARSRLLYKMEIDSPPANKLSRWAWLTPWRQSGRSRRS